MTADAVLIASPSGLHGTQAAQALRAGFAVLVEKPLAGSFAEAVDLVAAARSAGRPLMVAENYRFFRAERTLRRCLEEERVGRIRSVVCIDRRDQPSGTQGAWVRGMAQPFLTEIAVHHFDSFRYLFNRRPLAVWARTHNPAGSDYQQNAAAETLLEMEGDLHIQYSGSFVGSRYQYQLGISGDQGELRTDRSKVWWRPRGRRTFEQVKPVPMPDGEALRYPHAGMVSMLAQFSAAVGGGAPPETSGVDNLWTLAMFEAALRSTVSGRYVAIDEVFTPEMKIRAGLRGGG
jgi:predicted dehydrogenase